MNSIEPRQKQRLLSVFEVLLIILLASVPLFTSFPYRVNIFLSWEGAYRISQGQIPYKDFGMPMGYMYWVVPALFFKIFGPQLFTLVKAQVFINVVSGLAFRSILKSLNVSAGVRFLSVLLFCISYSFFNFWPWYNHTVIVYQLIGLACLFRYFFAAKPHWIWLSLAALFTFFSFFTKQDGGGMALMLALALLVFDIVMQRRWQPLLIFSASFGIAAFAIIAPLLSFNFGYWFNHGQPPHTARFSLMELADEFFSGTQWIKFYLMLIALLLVGFYQRHKMLFNDRKTSLFALLTLGILAEASVLQVTSYTPPDNNIFFHAFAFAFILYLLQTVMNISFLRSRLLIGSAFLLLLWWSGVFWKYVQRFTQRLQPAAQTVSARGENIVNRRTYMLSKDTADGSDAQWVFCGLNSFRKIYMPLSTAQGIQRLMKMEIIKNNKNLALLNMTELTPLAVEIPYALDKGPEIPLWYHLGVAMFNKEAAMYEQRILKKQYDVVLFENIPTLNNFYPFRVRDTLLRHYQKIDSFEAPRRGVETKGVIEVYVKH